MRLFGEDPLAPDGGEGLVLSFEPGLLIDGAGSRVSDE
jgi:hypothetical protein